MEEKKERSLVVLRKHGGGTAQTMSLHTKLPIWQRIDVFPFVIAYFILGYLHIFCYPEGGSRYILPVFDEALIRGNVTSAASNATVEVLASSSTTAEYEGLNWSFIGICAILITVPIHLGAIFAGFWSIKAKCFFRFKSLQKLIPSRKQSEEVYVCTIPKPHCGSAKMCPVIYDERAPHIVFQGSKYVFHVDKTHPQNGYFQDLDYPVDKTLLEYKKSKGLIGGWVSEAMSKYPPNEFDIPLPAFWDLFQEHAMAPFFVFQMFCVLLWCLDEYWYYSLISLVFLVLFEMNVVNQRINNLKKLREMRTPPYPIYVYRKEKWKLVLTSDLLPGDIVELLPTSASGGCPCDCLLLAGTCVVNEAMLTGESVPQVKESIGGGSDFKEGERLDISKHKRSIVFGGTQIILTDMPKGATKLKLRSFKDKGCLAFVLRTGFGTSQGTLVRTILFSTERVSINNVESLLFILFLVIFATIASAYVLMKGLEDDSRNRYKLILNCIMIITSVVPPELPMELSLAVNTSLLALIKQDVFCTEPFRIPLAGAVDICCFDKTGTLTSDRFNVLGASDPTADRPTILAPNNLLPFQRCILGGCHSIVYVNYRGPVGDPMEIASLEAMNWSIGKNQNSMSRNRQESVKIEHRYAFSSALQRMACINYVNHLGEYWITAKGAPEQMGPRFKELPENYHQTHKHFSAQGCRVLALGYRVLGSASVGRRRMPSKREDAERDLEFGGFLILHCPLKLHSLQTVTHLKESTHKVIMITGDHTLTACHVASKLGISDKPYPSNTLILTVTEEKEQTILKWVSVDEKLAIRFDSKQVESLERKYDLCVSGKSIFKLEEKHGIENLGIVIRKASVFARFSPSQKEMVLTRLKKFGIKTLMCGDGTNDVGALKQAHVGVALITREEIVSNAMKADMKDSVGEGPTSKLVSRRRGAGRVSRARASNTSSTRTREDVYGQEEVQVVRLGDASIASPFTSRRPYVSSVLNIIRQGRCTLVTTYQMFRILACNCLVTAYSMSVLYLDGVKFGDTQMTIAALTVTMFFFFVSRSTPLDKLSSERPAPSLFNVAFFVDIIGQFIIHLSALLLGVAWSWPHTPKDKDTLNPDGDFKANVLNSVVFLLSVSTTVATFLGNYRGHPFMISLFENKLLLYSLVITEVALVCFALELVPTINYYMELSPFPSTEFKLNVTALMLGDLFGTVLFVHLVRFFASAFSSRKNVSI